MFHLALITEQAPCRAANLRLPGAKYRSPKPRLPSASRAALRLFVMLHGLAVKTIFPAFVGGLPNRFLDEMPEPPEEARRPKSGKKRQEKLMSDCMLHPAP